MKYCAKDLSTRLEGQFIENIDDGDYQELAEAHDPFLTDPPYDTNFEIDCPVPDCSASFTVSSLGRTVATLERKGTCLAEGEGDRPN